MKKRDRHIKRRNRARAKLVGTKAKPRLTVFRSNKYIYGQIIDDEKGITMVSISAKEKKPKGEKNTKMDDAKNAGLSLAEKAKRKKIKKVVFDRSGYQYHGRVKAFADGARKGGLSF